MHHVETMAYNKAEIPWHGLGFPVEHDLTPEQMLKAAKVDWQVGKVPLFAKVNGVVRDTNQAALVRITGEAKKNKKKAVPIHEWPPLDYVSADWNLIQNLEAAEFFNEFVAAGNMNMETGGSLQNGKFVWFLAKIRESFDLFKGKDKIDGYLLFTNPHKYGFSSSVSLNTVRVVCWNTLNLSLNSTAKDRIVKISHRKVFDAEEVKETLGLSAKKMAEYKERSTFLTTKRAKDEDIVEYFNRLYPVAAGTQKEISTPAKTLQEIFGVQPGHEMGEGTWWQGYNAVTYYHDHVYGRDVKDAQGRVNALATQDNRLTNSWYGMGRGKKLKALELALDYAQKS